MSQSPDNASDSPASAGSRFRALLELGRVSNLSTAVADVMMGYLVTQPPGGELEHPGRFAILIAASCVLYTAGMVLNDVFDVEADAKERPSRPIPSGRISLRLARLLGFELLLTGVALGWLAAYVGGNPRAGIVATVLAGCIWLYDAGVKRTVLGPLAMGGCRMLNVLLGMSLAAEPFGGVHWVIAGGMGVYIVGVTWFARTEAGTSSRVQLGLASLVMMAGIGLFAWFPKWLDAPVWNIQVPRDRWYFFWIMIAALIGWRLFRAVASPSPAMVQAAVKQCILSIIMLDAAVCFAFQGYAGPNGIPWAVIILALLMPAMFLGRWIYST